MSSNQTIAAFNFILTTHNLLKNDHTQKSFAQLGHRPVGDLSRAVGSNLDSVNAYMKSPEFKKALEEGDEFALQVARVVSTVALLTKLHPLQPLDLPEGKKTETAFLKKAALLITLTGAGFVIGNSYYQPELTSIISDLFGKLTNNFAAVFSRLKPLIPNPTFFTHPSNFGFASPGF